MGVAVGLKPQIGLPFLIYYIIRRRWYAVSACVTTVSLLAAVAILYLSIKHVPWLDSYLYDNRMLFAYGSLGDFSQANPMRFSLINLQVLLYALLYDRMAANVAAFIICGILGVCWLIFLERRDGSEGELLSLSSLLVLSLLPIYHRFYDASLLIFPLAWAFTQLSGPLKRSAKAALLLIMVFLVPGGSALEQLQRTNRFHALQHSWWWARFVMPHQIWALIFLSVILLYAMRSSQANRPVEPL
jgi:hypothetical protein